MPRSLDEVLHNREFIADDPASFAIGDDACNAVLKDLQSNILTPHGLDRSHYWFLSFGERTPERRLELRYLLAMLARTAFERFMIRSAIAGDEGRALMTPEFRKIADAWREGAPCAITETQHSLVKDLRVVSEHELYWQRQGRADDAETDIEPDERCTVNVLLTARGYDKLGIPMPDGEAFRAGMASRRELLNDPSIESWEPEFIANGEVAIDALLIIAHDPLDPATQAGAAQIAALGALEQIVSAHTTILRKEEGNVIRIGYNGGSYLIEPFGYRDGVSQPIFYERERARRGVNVTRDTKWNPFAPLALALSPDPNSKLSYACGSYMVFRKLRQDIDKFYEQSERLAHASGLSESELRDQFVGRRPNGRPLIAPTGPINDFGFVDDQSGQRCPFHAHIRKNNPRSDVRASYAPESHRVVRRGVPYGPAIERNLDGTPQNGRMQIKADQPDALGTEVGILFLCAQRSIEDQFEHLQAQWANNAGHPRNAPSGVDTVSGQVFPNESHRITIPPAKRHDVGRVEAYAPVVGFKGGEYFFGLS